MIVGTKMTTSTRSEDKKSWMKKLRCLVVINIYSKKSQNLIVYSINVLIFSVSNRPTDKVNYILCAHYNRESAQKTFGSFISNLDSTLNAAVW